MNVDIREKLPLKGSYDHWLPRQLMELLTLEVFENHGGVALRDMVMGMVGWLGLDLWVFKVEEDLYDSVIIF